MPFGLTPPSASIDKRTAGPAGARRVPLALVSASALALALLAGCASAPAPGKGAAGGPPPAPPAADATSSAPAPGDRAHLSAFSAQLSGAAQVPPVRTAAAGRVEAVLDRNTRLLRWRLSYSGLSGPLVAAHFHGPAPVGGVAGVALRWPPVSASPMEGRATLSVAQMNDLLAGRWYVNLYTAAYSGGEIRGQMIEQR